jgi:hypothetical protein
MTKIADLVRALVRPVATGMLVSAQIAFVAAGLHTGNFEAAKIITPVAMMPLAWWFAERAVTK